MTEDDVRDRLRKFVSGHRRQYLAARELGVSAPWLNILLKGHKRPSGRILDFLGIERLGRGIDHRGKYSRGKEKSCFRLKSGIM